MIRSGDWKLWVFEDRDHLPPALFNLASDPGEETDLGTNPAYSDVRGHLLYVLRSDWDPETAGRQSAEQEEDLEVIARWGRMTGPKNTDALSVPDPELERDVELL